MYQPCILVVEGTSRLGHDTSRLAQKQPAVWALYGVWKQALGQKNELWLHSETGVFFEVSAKRLSQNSFFFHFTILQGPHT